MKQSPRRSLPAIGGSDLDPARTDRSAHAARGAQNSDGQGSAAVVSTTLDINGNKRGLQPTHGWGGTIAPVGRATERLPNRNCISMLSAGPRRRPESHEAAS